MDTMTSQTSRSTTTATSTVDPHPEWGDHTTTTLQKVDVPWVLSTWFWCVAATLVFSGIVSAIVAFGGNADLVGTDRGIGYGIGTVIFSLGTFISFTIVLAILLLRERGDRLINSLAISVVHVSAALVIMLGYLAVRAIVAPGAEGLVDGVWADRIGTTVSLLVEASPAAIFACLLAVGMVPAGGQPPAGTINPTSSDDLM